MVSAVHASQTKYGHRFSLQPPPHLLKISTGSVDLSGVKKLLPNIIILSQLRKLPSTVILLAAPDGIYHIIGQATCNSSSPLGQELWGEVGPCRTTRGDTITCLVVLLQTYCWLIETWPFMCGSARAGERRPMWANRMRKISALA